MIRVAKTAQQMNFFEGTGKNLETSKRTSRRSSSVEMSAFGHRKKSNFFFNRVKKIYPTDLVGCGMVC